MKQWKRLIYYLMINVLVSACTVLAVLTVWDRTHPPAASGGEPVALDVPSPLPSNAVVASTDAPVSGTAEAPVVTPTSSPTPTAVKDVQQYQVQPGDTLGLIAQKYDVSLEDLMNFNSLSDPNSLSVGQVIYIPVTPEVVPTNTLAPTNTPAPQVTLTLAGPLPPAEVVIDSVIGVGDLASEHVYIRRTGYGDLSLAGWQLKDENGNVFVFPQLELFQGGAVNVWSTVGSPTVVDLYWNLQTPVWRSGEKVTLLDAGGKVRATYTTP
jgi:LysM repeat protein